MLRSDKLGVTSVIRDLALSPDCYLSMLHFFRASSWSLDSIRLRWFSVVRDEFPLYKEGNFHVLVGDGVKQSKEGRRMPGVKKLFQESENSAKPEYIHGHMFGGLGILAGNPQNLACVPLSIRLHDGLQAAHEWKETPVSLASHVLKMVGDAYRAAQTFGDCLLLLDRSFLTMPALQTLSALNRSGPVRLEIVTKAKKSCTAYEKPAPRKPGRGRPPKKGAVVRLRELFDSHRERFLETRVELYGKQAGIWGAFFATIGVIFPSFVIILIVTILFQNILKKTYIQAILKGVKPCLMGIILATGIYMAASICIERTSFSVDLTACIIFLLLAIVIFLHRKFRGKELSPILLIALSAIYGCFFY